MKKALLTSVLYDACFDKRRQVCYHKRSAVEIYGELTACFSWRGEKDELRKENENVFHA